eukprot:CAMPEP_0204868634 /NCGR_PEP_ID=MMETSP1348-20121228/27363_1 /ASSEMBLY_ACC=CAM_ASM_000700 /TAXON_ID=215587 /ORGANISM="Aplanochytrium stocchinoi, Strain GSBS06" /LENGTH=288 /DNA_ID=CAMNT_0052021657 /DNA_START=122 /DNA_END=985 /DNA_ORIENTATION=+
MTVATKKEAESVYGSRYETVEGKIDQLELEKKSEAATIAMDQDPRFTFTDEEFKCILQLKDMCATEGVKYNSIFELAKYQIGVWSDGPSKRIENAFKNLKKRREFEQKHSRMFSHDLVDSINMMVDNFPDFYAASGLVQSNLRHVAVNVGDLDFKRVISDEAIMDKMALFYLEVTRLCTIDLEELRRGMGVITDYRGVGFYNMYPCLKFLKSLTELTAGPTHATRLKKVSVLMPPALSKFVNLGIAIAPKKLRSRISLGYNLDNFKELDLSQVPLHYGGSFEMHTQEW